MLCWWNICGSIFVCEYFRFFVVIVNGLLPNAFQSLFFCKRNFIFFDGWRLVKSNWNLRCQCNFVLAHNDPSCFAWNQCVHSWKVTAIATRTLYITINTYKDKYNYDTEITFQHEFISLCYLVVWQLSYNTTSCSIWCGSNIKMRTHSVSNMFVELNWSEPLSVCVCLHVDMISGLQKYQQLFLGDFFSPKI